VITFYNSVFIPHVENFLLQFKPTEKDGNNNNTTSAQESKPQSPKVANNVYLSPMRPQLRSQTPGSSSKGYSYSFGESPAKDLLQINHSINSSSKAKKPIKRLFSDNGDEAMQITESSLKRKYDELGVVVDNSEKENEQNTKHHRV